jgi:hypothetical protein
VEEKLRVHDFVFVLVLVLISFMDLGNLEEGPKKRRERKKARQKIKIAF